MADPRGFLKITERNLVPLRSVSARLNDFNDVHESVDNSAKISLTMPQSSRCMDCGVPFCHFSCPLGNLIPEWNDYAYQGKWREAYERLSATNNFPEFTGRLCPALCEAGCVLGSINPAVTIESIESVISDVAFRREYVEPHPADKVTGKVVAVVGSGPAGLAAAQQLTRAGHTVVVFEKSDKPGGLLRYGIPNFKLEKSLIDRRLNQLIAEGVRFRTGVNVGGRGADDISWSDLRSQYDAVLIATGTGIPNDLPLPGRELDGIHFAMEFLPTATKVALGEKSPDDADVISAEGKRVLIIGGGDTGSDCLGTSLRQGADHVVTLQVLPEPPSERSGKDFYGEQPWPVYPALNRISTSLEEGAESEKSEVLFETTATEFIGNPDGHVQAVKLAATEFKDGKFLPIPGTERVEQFDLVFLSIGFKGPDTSTLVAELGVELTERGLISRNEQFATSEDAVFVCGDAGRGQSLIVWAIAEGRSAAAAIDRYLQGSTELPAPICTTSQGLKA